jgi:hypothetical protein
MSAFQFWRHCRFSDWPLHLRGGALAWKAFHKWSLPYLRETLAETPVTLAKTSFGVFDYNANATTGPVTELERLPFTQAVDAVLASSEAGTDFSYIQQHSIADKFPQILKDVNRPQWLDPTKFMYEVNLWLGSAGCFSPLHYDLADNFLVQISGRKHLTLFSKNDGNFLYPNLGQELDHCSMVDVRRPDLARFPQFRKAQAYSVLLEPGDVIYIPRRWWHAVHSLDTAISVNYWWGGIFDAVREGAQLVWTPAGRQEIVGFLRGLRASGDAK